VLLLREELHNGLRRPTVEIHGLFPESQMAQDASNFWEYSLRRRARANSTTTFIAITAKKTAPNIFKSLSMCMGGSLLIQGTRSIKGAWFFNGF
jgi:hypothetical protein